MPSSRPSASPVVVNLAVADTFAFFSPVSITIAPGATAGTANLNGRSAGTTQIFAVDGDGGGYAGDTAVLAVQAGVRFTSGNYTLLVADEVPTESRLATEGFDDAHAKSIPVIATSSVS